MTKYDKILLLAMVLGDGSVRHNKPEFCISHGLEQKDYLEYKAKLVEKAVGKPVNVKPIHGSTGNKEPVGARFSITHEYFRLLRKRCYDKDRNPRFRKAQLYKLEPYAIAIWYMDDGSLHTKKKDGKVHAYELTISCCAAYEKDAVNIVNFFKRTYDINFTVKRNKGRFSVRCGTKEARKFIELVRPYIIPSMQSKIALDS